MPAVAEPLIVWILGVAATVEERGVGEDWSSSEVKKGGFFLTTSSVPYGMRRRVTSPEPFVVMHIYIGLYLFERAIHETHEGISGSICLREVSGGQDE